MQQLLSAPAGCAFLVAVHDSGLPLAAACAPATAFALAAGAVAAVDVWRADYARSLARFLGIRALPVRVHRH